MTINNIEVKWLNVGITEGCTGYRILMKDGKVFEIKWDTKSNPAVSECKTYDPQSITFQGDAKRPTLCTVTYKTGETLRGKIQLVSLNDDEQKVYDRSQSYIKTVEDNKRELEKRETEYKRKQSEQEELIRLQIRALKQDAGETVEQTDHSYSTRVYCFQSWEEYKKSKHGVGFKYTYSKMLKDGRFNDELKRRGVKSGKEIEKNIRAHRKNLKLKDSTSNQKTK